METGDINPEGILALTKTNTMDSQPQLSVSEGDKTPSISKNQLKKLKRQEAWEANSEARKARRKEKRKERKRAAPEVKPMIPDNSEQQQKQGTNEEDDHRETKKGKGRQCIKVPITLVIDCGFDDLMMDKERVSLASQITRCYSDNQKARYQTHLAVSSFGGPLKDRFDGILEGQYRSWSGVQFFAEDFIDTATQSQEWMKSERGGKLAGIFAKYGGNAEASEGISKVGEVVYLTSDSPDTLTELKPYGTYIIGGLVDRNRHKGICYKRAMDRGMKTAKLPIGDYMQMSSRFVLTTNHVAETMLRWLELGDWGQAFLQVVPKRKGGVLKDSNGQPSEGIADVITEGGVEKGFGRAVDAGLSEDERNEPQCALQELPDKGDDGDSIRPIVADKGGPPDADTKTALTEDNGLERIETNDGSQVERTQAT